MSGFFCIFAQTKQNMIHLKSKQELDEIKTHDELMNYRYSILRNSDFDRMECQRYVDEFRLYEQLRFKQLELDRYERYRHDAKKEGLGADAAKIIIQIGDNESIYKFMTESEAKLLKPFKYIEMDI